MILSRGASIFFAGIIVFACCICPLYAQTQKETDVTVLERGANHKIVQHVTWTTDEKGEPVAQTNSFTELATGLNFKNEKGEWEESREEIEILDKGAGAAARHGQHKVFFPLDIYDGQIELQTSDGQWLRSRVLGLSYYDSGSGKSVLIAEVTNSIGEVQGKNVLIYPEAFTEIQASLRLIYTKRGFEQDVVLLEQPPSPEKFGLNPETTRLQVLTEFFNPPQPEKRELAMKDSKGETMMDEHLDFGALQMIPGKAFSADQAETENKVPVSKQWLKLEGRDFLIEEVEIKAVEKELELLPKARSASLQNITNAVRQAKLGKPVLPAKRLATKNPASKPMRMAKADALSKGFVMDYATVNSGQSDYTFKGDTTYYISAPVTLSGTTTFEAGAVLKYAVNAKLTFAPGSSIASKATPYRPVIFTAMHDNSVGEVVNSGTLSGYYANPALSFLSFGSVNLNDFRISHALTGISATSGVLGITNAQFVNCQNGISVGNAAATLANALFANVPFSFSSLQYANVTAENVTFNGTVNYPMTFSTLAGGAGPCTVTLRNCIVANMTLFFAGPPTGITLSGSHNGFYNTPTLPPGFTTSFAPAGGVSPFQALVGAGNYYLKANANGTDASGFRNQGTTTINTTLLTELRKKTTFAPANPPAVNPSGTTWNKTPIRDDDGFPDLGYHYEPLDYWVSGYTISGSLHTFAPGVAIGFHGSSGFVVQGGAGMTMSGRPDSMNRLVWYPSVQEQPTRVGNISTYGSALFNVSSTPGGPKLITLNYTDVSMQGGRQKFFDLAYPYYWPYLQLKNCSLRGVNLTVGQLYYAGIPSTQVALHNNLLERCTVSLINGYLNYNGDIIQNPVDVQLYNNLFWSNTVSLNYQESQDVFKPVWNIKDNLFDGATISMTGDGAYLAQISRGYNGYFNTPNGLQETTPLTLTALTYAAGPLGKWYINQASSATTPDIALENVGSRSASAAGLFHYTTTTSQQKEGFSTVDIGMHYVAVDAATGVPLNADPVSDNVPDYLEDANGNGIVDLPSEQTSPWHDTDGYWTDPFDMGDKRGQAIHATLLPTGRVVCWPNGDGPMREFIPPPITTEIESVPNQSPSSMISTRAKPDLYAFCTGHTLMQDGSLFLAGGHIATPIGLKHMAAYSPFDDFWTMLPRMNEGRWYPSCTTLDNGEILIVGGTFGTGNPQMLIDDNNRPEVWNPQTGLLILA